MAYQGNNNTSGNNRPNNNGQNNGKDRYPNNQNKNSYEQVVELPEITLDYKSQVQLFGDVAKKWSEQLEKESDRTSNKINQIRSFYDKVMELNEKAQNMTDETYKKEVFPFVIMLNSKVAYTKTRSLVSGTFVKMMNQCVEKAITVEKMNNFKLFFEAVIGFYPKK